MLDFEALEKERGVRILYACEAGSRAWGFPSPDSDWDIRFIYAHPRDHYLTVRKERKDTIENASQMPYDASGWDLQKALYLFTRSNGALIEWLGSPTVYFRRGSLAEQLRAMAPRFYNPTALCYHYSHMARGNAKEYLFGQERIKMKKYLYVLRPLLAIRWIKRTGGIPPVPFSTLVEAEAPPWILPELGVLLARKQRAMEPEKCEPFTTLNEFIQQELEETAFQFAGDGRPVGRWREMDQLFRGILAEAEE